MIINFQDSSRTTNVVRESESESESDSKNTFSRKQKIEEVLDSEEFGT
jgi:hypothetical protein